MVPPAICIFFAEFDTSVICIVCSNTMFRLIFIKICYKVSNYWFYRDKVCNVP